MKEKESLTRAIKRIQDAIDDPYDGTMYEGGKSIRGEWINGIRKSDAILLLKTLTDKAQL